MKYLSLFSGIGGFEKGIQQAYEDIQKLCVENKRESKMPSSGNKKGSDEQLSELCNERLSCVGYSEINKYAIQIYEKHFPEHKNYGDITKINEKELPDFDLLVGGFPCQSFSIAGKRRGFEDTRGTLFFDIARILSEKQPSLLLLENVKGLLSHDKGNTFKTIIRTLDELGYDLQWQVLNSKNFGVPQNRERVFIVGHLRGTSRPEVFPIGESSGKNLKEYTRGQSQGNRVYSVKGISTTIASQAGGLGAKTGLYGIDLSMQEAKITKNARTIQARYFKGYSNRKAETTGVINDKFKIRRLNPKECERLQGFPDDWTAEGTEGKISDTQRYKCLGNAVTVNVIEEIIKRVIS